MIELSENQDGDLVKDDILSPLRAHIYYKPFGFSYWEDIFVNVYFRAVKWRTVDKGLQRLADAFELLVNGRISYSRWVGLWD